MLSAFSFVPMRRLADVRVPDDWQFVLALRACLEKPARRGTNTIACRRARAFLLELWNATEPPARSLADALSSDPDARQASARSRSNDRSFPVAAGCSARALDHFIMRTRGLGSASRRSRLPTPTLLAAHAAESQRDAERLIDNQIPATSDSWKAAVSQGAFAASSFGAGFGGSVWALVDRRSAEAFARRWHPEAFLANPGPPLTLLTSEP